VRLDCRHIWALFLERQERERERRESKDGFAIGNSIAQQLEQDPTPASDRIITTIFRCSEMCTLLQLGVKAPKMTNPEEFKEEFYNGGEFLVLINW